MAGSTGQPTYSWFPFAGHKAQGGVVWVRGNSSAMLGMGYIENDNADQNAYLERDFWLDSVTWKYCHVGRKDPNNGILTLNFNGVSQGTIDLYAAATTENNYSEIATTVAIAGVKTVQTIAATKNASSAGYRLWFSGEALIATSQVGASTPGGTDTPGYTVEIVPFMGSKANTGWDTRTQASLHIGGGYLENGAIQNQVVSWDIWQDTGTGKFAQVYAKDTNVGIYHIQIDGSDVGTIDAYAAAAVGNQYSEVTGLVVATAGVKALGIKTATKNASSTGFKGYLNSIKWIRTGA